MKTFNFLKAHGLSNDFVIFFNQDNINISRKLIQFICDRKIGIGCDLVVFINESVNEYSDLISRFFNKDGSEAEICGNALRCIGKYYFNKIRKKNITVETNSGLIDIEAYNESLIAVDLGKPYLQWDKIPISMELDTKNLGIDFKYLKGGVAVNVGNPHVIFFAENLDKKQLEIDSKKILRDTLFHKGVNISVVKVVSNNQIKVLTYERGVGITDACGSGAGASAFVSYKLNYCKRKIRVCMNGGDLNVEITNDEHILTIGDAKEVFEGTIKLDN